MRIALLRSLFLVYVLTATVFSHNAYVCFSNGGFKLTVYVAPPVLPADGREHMCVYVQIQSAEGMPVKAASDVEVVLTSSNLEVGAVEEVVTIHKGQDFTTARFTTTLTAGETVITASSPGLETGAAVLKTASSIVGSLPPYALKVTVSPGVLPAVEGFKGIVSVQIIDRFGALINAPSDTRVVLASSNLSILEVSDSLVIPKGCNYAIAFFKVKGAVGSASLTALAQGFEPGNATVSTVRVGGEPSRLVLALICPVLPSGGMIHRYAIVIGLFDAGGAPTPARKDVKVAIASSNPSIIRVPDEVTVERGSFYAIVEVMTGFEEGRVVLAASSQGLEADAMTLEARRCIGLSDLRLKLVVYMALPTVVADGEPKEIVVVQIQSGGMPTALMQNTTVYLTSSVDIGSIPLKIVIKPGETYAVAPFTPLSTGTTNVTASAQGLEPSTVRLTAILLPMNVTMEVPSKVEVNQTYTVSLSAASLGIPLSDASVNWTVVGGEVVFELRRTDVDGRAYLTVKQTATALTVMAQVSKPGYETTTSVRRVEVAPPPLAPKALEIELLGFKVQVLHLMMATACAAVLLTLAYYYLKRRARKGSSKEEGR
ncbi:hypothetical protein KEJ25_05720 [Candidatus Bathyarchaeota archaeon]|nr:hypothetical protein [Candidatus Bathyarchaeota archaeon]